MTTIFAWRMEAGRVPSPKATWKTESNSGKRTSLYSLKISKGRPSIPGDLLFYREATASPTSSRVMGESKNALCSPDNMEKDKLLRKAAISTEDLVEQDW